MIGGVATGYRSQPRFTKDLHLWLQPSKTNVARVLRAFEESGMPLVDVTSDDFQSDGLQYMVGRAPVLFDFLPAVPRRDARSP